MKVLVVGLGSMGKRRVRNLLALGVTGITGFDVREDRRNEAAGKYGIRTSSDVDTALQERPDAVVISTPPDLHIGYALKAVNAGVPFFSEAGVPDARLPELRARMRETGVIGMPSSTMRFFAAPQRLKAIVSGGPIGRPLAWVYQSGQYLPDWHPWEAIQSFYVSNPVTGACREIVPFELVWLVDVFGPVTSVAAQRAKVSDLPVAIDDIYQLQLRHQNGTMGQLTVDVLARTPIRHIRITSTDGVAEWDAAANEIRIFRAAEGAWSAESLNRGTVETGYVNPEEPYIEEMREFADCVIRRRKPAYGYADDQAVLDVLVAAERSADQGVRIDLARPGSEVR